MNFAYYNNRWVKIKSYTRWIVILIMSDYTVVWDSWRLWFLLICNPSTSVVPSYNVDIYIYMYTYVLYWRIARDPISPCRLTITFTLSFWIIVRNIIIYFRFLFNFTMNIIYIIIRTKIIFFMFIRFPFCTSIIRIFFANIKIPSNFVCFFWKILSK